MRIRQAFRHPAIHAFLEAAARRNFCLDIVKKLLPLKRCHNICPPCSGIPRIQRGHCAEPCHTSRRRNASQCALVHMLRGTGMPAVPALLFASFESLENSADTSFHITSKKSTYPYDYAFRGLSSHSIIMFCAYLCVIADSFINLALGLGHDCILSIQYLPILYYIEKCVGDRLPGSLVTSLPTGLDLRAHKSVPVGESVCASGVLCGCALR